MTFNTLREAASSLGPPTAQATLLQIDGLSSGMSGAGSTYFSSCLEDSVPPEPRADVVHYASEEREGGIPALNHLPQHALPPPRSAPPRHPLESRPHTLTLSRAVRFGLT